MPASMMSAEAGGRPNVNGSSIATVVSGEMPGNTPTSVPIMTPAKQNSRFCQRCRRGEAERQIVEQLHAILTRARLSSAGRN